LGKVRSAVIYIMTAIFLMFSIVAAAAFYSLKNDQNLRANLLRNGERTSGKIVDIHGARGRSTYIDMEFQTLDGRDVKATYLNSFTFPERDGIAKGMSVDVVYDRTVPSRAIPVPYQTVLQRDVASELIEFLVRIGLAVLMVSPLIVGSALFLNRKSSGRTNAPK
jgi:hypothetical protein